MDELPNFFDETIASGYDHAESEMFTAETVARPVEVLAALAGDGRALELGIGTGRIALPLAARGISVAGIDLSPAMVDQMRAKPGGNDVEVAIGDFATTRVAGTFTVAYLVFNTIMNLTTQTAQVACFSNVASHLEPGGTFVVECMVPQLRRLPPGSTLVQFDGGENGWGLDEYDVANQRLTSHHFEAHSRQPSNPAMPFRYVWPSELDLMAMMAGMRLRDRWSDWNGEPFTSDSDNHVSIWEK